MRAFSRARAFIAAVVTGTSLLLSGCIWDIGMGASSKTAPGLDGLYTADCEIVCAEADEEFVYGGKMTRMGGGNWELELSSPDTVRGLRINVGDEGMTASLGDLNFRIETEKIPNRAAFLTVFGILDTAANSELGFYETETELCYKGTYGNEAFTLKYEKAGNTLCGLECGSISASFANFTVTGVPETSGTAVSQTETALTSPAE